MEKLRVTIWLPKEGKAIWKQVKAQASLEGKTIGTWLLDLIKKELTHSEATHNLVSDS
jgi:hypothetical protein